MVPEGWVMRTVGQLFDVQLGKMLSKIAKEKHPQYRYLGNRNVRWDGFKKNDLNEMHFSDKEKEKFTLLDGDILMCEGGEVGRCSVWNDAYEKIYYQKALHRLRGKGSISPHYFQQYMQLVSASKLLEDFTSRTSIAHLTREKLLELPVKCPPFPEQQKIAKILQTWDRAIATTEKLIDASKRQKKALMQQLLTGKKRFTGFEGECIKNTTHGPIPADWKYLQIKDIAEHYSEKNSQDVKYPVVSCSKHVGFVDSLQYFKKKVYSEDLSGYKLIPKGFFGFPSNHIEEGSIGCQEEHEFGLVSPIYTVFRPKVDLIDSKYLISMLKTDQYRQIFSAATNSSVDRRGSLKWKEFSLIKVPLPSLDEQLKISSVITTSDQEILLFNKKLLHLKQEKKALMQQLLTGQRRVKVDD